MDQAMQILGKLIDIAFAEMGVGGVILLLLVIWLMFRLIRCEKQRDLLTQTIVKEVREGSNKYAYIASNNADSNRELSTALMNLAEKVELATKFAKIAERGSADTIEGR
jgi:hypothetical protein